LLKCATDPFSRHRSRGQLASHLMHKYQYRDIRTHDLAIKKKNWEAQSQQLNTARSLGFATLTTYQIRNKLMAPSTLFAVASDRSLARSHRFYAVTVTTGRQVQKRNPLPHHHQPKKWHPLRNCFCPPHQPNNHPHLEKPDAAISMDRRSNYIHSHDRARSPPLSTSYRARGAC